MILRPEQRRVVDEAKPIIASKHIVYLACEIRVGKSAMSLTIANEGVNRKYHKVLFVTKKIAIASVESDFNKLGYSYSLKVINYEQLNKEHPNYDLIIADEAHGLGAFAKPSLRAKEMKRVLGHADLILMSGTPHPQTPSQIYHQFWVHKDSPFALTHPNFYKWAKDFVTLKKKYVNGLELNDYSHAKVELVKEAIAPYMVSLSQEQAGFTSFVEEEIMRVSIDTKIYDLMKVLKRDKVYKMKTNDDIIICDTPVKLQSVFHQLSSGTIKIEDKRYVIDDSKARFIQEKFKGQKIAIYFLFIAEGDLLRKMFPNHTDVPEVFNSTDDSVFIKQVVSGSMGVNLSTADTLVMYNIPFSAGTYWQVRGRMQTKDRVKKSKIAWIFSDNGIEQAIYKAVMNKKDFTLNFFKKYLKDGI